MPLSEDEQRILHQIEQQFYESDPAFAREVGKTTLYRHAGRNLKWATLGFVVGFGVLIAFFTASLLVGFAGFLVMLGSAFVFERNLRKMGRAGWTELSGRAKTNDFRQSLGSAGKKFRKKFRRDE